MSGAEWNDPRPMSPHLQVWRWHVTMATSILHRGTGIALSAGMALITGWLVALAIGPEAYAWWEAVAGSVFGKLVLLGFCVAVCFHLVNGLRFLFWDAGKGFDPRFANLTAWAAIAFGALAGGAIFFLTIGF